MRSKEEIELIIKNVEVWQNFEYGHHLTCGNNSLHADLVPFENNGEVKLKCLDCDYIQDHIPDVVTREGAAEYLEKLNEQYKKLFETNNLE